MEDHAGACLREHGRLQARVLIGLTVGMLLADEHLPPWYPFLFLWVVGLSLAACHEFIRLLGPNRRPQVLVLLNYDLGRFQAANSTLNYGHVDLLRLPAALFHAEPAPGLPRTDAATAWLDRLTQLLRDRSIDYDLSDTHIDTARLHRYSTVFVQSAGFLAEEDQRTLRTFSEHGGSLVIGHELPSRDAYLRPCALLSGTAVPFDALDAVLDGLQLRPDFWSDDPFVEVVPHYDGGRTPARYQCAHY